MSPECWARICVRFSRSIAAAGAGEDHHAACMIGRDRVERGMQLAHAVEIDRVQAFGFLERQNADAGLDVFRAYVAHR
jgi:hypothetical protein